jgi:hypothetical protein
MMRTTGVATDSIIDCSASRVECKGLAIAAKKRQRETEHASARSGCSVLGAWMTRQGLDPKEGPVSDMLPELLWPTTLSRPGNLQL